MSTEQTPKTEAGLHAQPPHEPPAAERGPHREPGTAVIPTGEAVGSRIGAYKLLQEIGEGGCGMVYLAEQAEPIRRRVALKVIKLGMDSRQVIARFEAERQALAMMDHPNIAKVLDAGTTSSGRPFFVMELVRGIPITRYCDEAELATRDRLKLFIEVCKAIQHAHQKGIIHRDIKPSNILVALHDNAPVPKVIDFGIAKATEAKLTDKTLFTGYTAFVGTPAYMSPEQAGLEGLDIDTRSDIYSLGVLLYELLVGQPPFRSEDLAQAGLDEARRRIREQDPVKPSTRLHATRREEMAALAERRATSPAELLRHLEGDLDWIVMKALEKERTRRYDSASTLAKDIERFLNNEPVAARPPSTLYRLRKFARRNKVAFAATVVMAVAAVAVFATLSLGLTVSTILLLREREARQIADRAQREVALTQAEVLAFGNPELIERVTRVRESQGQLRNAAQLLNQGRLIEAEPLLDELVRSGAKGGNLLVQVLQMRADLKARQSRFSEAAVDLHRLTQIQPTDHWNWFVLAPALLKADDRAAYESTRLAMLEQFVGTTNPLTAERILKAACLKPLGDKEPPLVTTLAGTVVSRGLQGEQAEEFTEFRAAFNLCEGLAQYRLGNYEAARRSALLALPNNYPLLIPPAHAALAMSQYRLGQYADARASLQAARLNARKQEPLRRDTDLGQIWNDVLITDILVEEAAALIEGQPGAKPNPDPDTRSQPDDRPALH